MLHTFSSIKQTLDTHLLLIGAISSVNKKIYDKKLCYNLYEVSTISDPENLNHPSLESCSNYHKYLVLLLSVYSHCILYV